MTFTVICDRCSAQSPCLDMSSLNDWAINHLCPEEIFGEVMSGGG